MNRQSALLAGLGFVLVLVLFYLFVWSPKSDELADVEQQTEDAVAQQTLLQGQIRQLEDVRSAAPQLEAALAAAESLVPREAALPAALRQLQLAADDSGITLTSISPGRPAALEEGTTGGLSSIAIAVSAEGSYFQLVDFLRRIEDPELTPRVILFSDVSVSESAYPTLSVSLTGRMFAQLPAPPVVEVEPVEPVEPGAEATPAPSEDPEATA